MKKLYICESEQDIILFALAKYSDAQLNLMTSVTSAGFKPDDRAVRELRNNREDTIRMMEKVQHAQPITPDEHRAYMDLYMNVCPA